jgi:hypothetical protein
LNSIIFSRSEALAEASSETIGAEVASGRTMAVREMVRLGWVGGRWRERAV